MKTKSTAGLILLTALLACRTNTQSDQSAHSSSAEKISLTDTLKYTFDSVKIFSKTKVLPAAQNQEPTIARVTFPLFERKNINQFVAGQVMTLSGKNTQFKNYQELSAGFIQEFDAFNTPGNNSNGNPWFQYIDLKVAANYPNYLAVKFIFSEYKGGAHPNTLYAYLNYNPQSGKIITLDSLIKPDDKPQLLTIAEKIFRKDEKLTPSASLSDGYFFDGGKFALAQTFMLSPEGLKFLYNPYEIKPYASGTTQLIIPYSQIKALLKPASILTNFIP